MTEDLYIQRDSESSPLIRIKAQRDRRFVGEVIFVIFYCGGSVVSIVLAENLLFLLLGFGLVLFGVYLVPALLLHSRSMLLVSQATYILTKESISFQKGRLNRTIRWEDVEFVNLSFCLPSLRLSLSVSFSRRFPSSKSVFTRLEGLESERDRIPLTSKLLKENPKFAVTILARLLHEKILTQSEKILGSETMQT